MSIYTFQNEPFEWNSSTQGTAPTAEEIALGLHGGMALPASFVNQQWIATYKCIDEIQQMIANGTLFTIPVDLNVAYTVNIGTYHQLLGQATQGQGARFVAGHANIASNLNFVIGKKSKTPTAATFGESVGDLFVVGNGLGLYDDGMRSNAFRVTADGQVLGTQAYAASGADFAECFEWADGNPDNEDRRGRFVTLDGEKIRLATADDEYILGAVSATPTVIGDAHTDDWHGKYVTDVFGARVLENGAWKLTEDFEEEQDTNYTSRLKRAEWAAVGLVGKLIVVDDGTCQVNGYCKPSGNGIATAAETGFRVMARMDDTHIKVLIK